MVSRLTVAPYTWSEMRRDLPGGQPARRQRQHDLIHPIQPTLPLAHDGRRETAVPVAGHLNLDRLDLGNTVLVRVPSRELSPLRPIGSCLS
jgi:hypothetical protein